LDICHLKGIKEEPPNGDPPKLLIGLIPGIPIVPMDIGDIGEPKPIGEPKLLIGLMPGIPIVPIDIGDIGEPKLLNGDPPPNDENGEFEPPNDEKGLLVKLLPKFGKPLVPLPPKGEKLELLTEFCG